MKVCDKEIDMDYVAGFAKRHGESVSDFILKSIEERIERVIKDEAVDLVCFLAEKLDEAGYEPMPTIAKIKDLQSLADAYYEGEDSFQQELDVQLDKVFA